MPSDTGPHISPVPAPRPVAAPVPARSPFVPLLISLLALLSYFGAQAWEIQRQRATLQGLHAGQQQTVDNAAKLRGSLDALASDTQRLATAGNANAGLLVDELRKRGVTINVAAPTAASAAAPR